MFGLQLWEPHFQLWQKTPWKLKNACVSWRSNQKNHGCVVPVGISLSLKTGVLPKTAFFPIFTGVSYQGSVSRRWFFLVNHLIQHVNFQFSSGLHSLLPLAAHDLALNLLTWPMSSTCRFQKAISEEFPLVHTWPRTRTFLGLTSHYLDGFIIQNRPKHQLA